MLGLEENENCISGARTCDPCFALDQLPPGTKRTAGRTDLPGCRKECLQSKDCLALAWNYLGRTCFLFGKGDEIWTIEKKGFIFEQKSCAKINSEATMSLTGERQVPGILLKLSLISTDFQWQAWQYQPWWFYAPSFVLP